MTSQQVFAHKAREIDQRIRKDVTATRAALERGEAGPLSALQILDGESIYLVAVENDELPNHRPGQVVCTDIKTAAKRILQRSHAIASTSDIERDAQLASAHQAAMQAAEDRTYQRRTLTVAPLTPSKGGTK